MHARKLTGIVYFLLPWSVPPVFDESSPHTIQFKFSKWLSIHFIIFLNIPLVLLSEYQLCGLHSNFTFWSDLKTSSTLLFLHLILFGCLCHHLQTLCFVVVLLVFISVVSAGACNLLGRRNYSVIVLFQHLMNAMIILQWYYMELNFQRPKCCYSFIKIFALHVPHAKIIPWYCRKRIFYDMLIIINCILS